MERKSIIMLALSVLFCMNAIAQEWEWLYPYPTPSHVIDFHFIDASTGFLITTTEFFKTTDGGTTWSQERFSDVSFKSVYFIDNNRGWILCDGVGYSNSPRVYRTLNGGNTWTTYDISSSYYDNYFTMFFLDESIGWVGGESGMVKMTSNGGQTWANRPVDGSNLPNLIYVHFTDQNNGVVAGSSSGYNNRGLLLASTTNGGLSWDSELAGISNTAYGFTSALPGIYYAACDYGLILHTTNNGSMWSFPSGTIQATLYGLAFANATNGWAVGTSGTLMKTVDGGLHWDQVLIGVNSEFSKIAFTDANTGWILGDRSSSASSVKALLKTENSGQSWVNKFRTFDENLNFRDVKFVNQNEGWMVASNYIYRSGDGGHQWNIQHMSTSEYYYGIEALDAQTAFCVGKKSSNTLILKTTNGGTNWTSQTFPISGELWDVCFVSAMEGWIAGDRGTVLHTDNGGGSWEIQSSGVTNDLYRIFFIDANHGWALDHSRTLLLTVDGGTTWTTSSYSESPYCRSVYFINNSFGWLGTSGGLYKSNDGGDKWSRITLPSSSYDEIVDIYFKDQNTGWILGQGYNQTMIYKTTDSGITWENEFTASDDMNRFDFIPQGDGWVVGENSMIAYYNTDSNGYRSKNGSIPTAMELFQNYPNPFNPVTMIKYDLSKNAKVKLTIYDIRGREVITLLDEQQTPGTYQVEFQNEDLPSGTYFYRIQADDFISTKKMVLMR